MNSSPLNGAGIPRAVLSQLQYVLLSCDMFKNYQELQTFFIDSRIVQWREQVPYADSQHQLVKSTISYLYRQFDKDRNNALVLFLKVLGENVPSSSGHQEILFGLADKLDGIWKVQPTSSYRETKLNKSWDNALKLILDFVTHFRSQQGGQNIINNAQVQGENVRVEQNVDNRKSVYWPFLVFVISVGAIFAYFVLQLSAEERQVDDLPKVMTGQFNIAIAEFILQDANGYVIDGNQGQITSEAIYEEVNDLLEDMETPNLQVWEPSLVGQITNEDDIEVYAKQINAHLIVYGVITVTENGNQLTPQFFVNVEGFEIASDFLELSVVKEPIQFFSSSSFNSNNSRYIDILSKRVQVLVLVALAVDDIFNRAPNKAIAKLTQADGFFKNDLLSDDDTDDGREVIHVLIGNAYLGKYFVSPEDVQEARYAFRMAEIYNRDYARALLGLGHTLLIQFTNHNGTFESSYPPDVDLLNKASEKYELALEVAQSQLEPYDILMKAHYGLGRIDFYESGLCIEINQTCTEDELNYVDAKKNFTEILNIYSSFYQSKKPQSNHAVLIGNTYYWMGIIESEIGNDSQAINYIGSALEIAPPISHSTYFYLLALIYADNDDKSQAIHYFEECITFAETFDIDNDVTNCTEAIEQLNQG